MTPVLSVAHRGASAYAPENTLAAVREGVRRGSDLVEVDVQRSRDGALVVMHDTTLRRTTDVERVFPGRAPWRVGEFTLAEIQRLDAGSWFAPAYAGERVPTLRDVLDGLRGTGTGLLLEVKLPSLYPGIAADLVTELRAARGWVGRRPDPRHLMVQSFNWRCMREVADRLPRVPIGLLGRPPAASLPEMAGFAAQVGLGHRSIDEQYVARVQDAGMTVGVFTVDAPYDMSRAIDLAVDSIITNRPDVLRGLLSAREIMAA